MKVKLILLALVALMNLQVDAQDRVELQWQSIPEEISFDEDKWGGYSAVFLFNRIKSTYTEEGGNIKHVKTIHRRVRLLNEEAVNGFNTLQIPYTDDYQIHNFRARSIHADGSVTDIDNNEIESASEGQMKLNLVAFKNLKIGDDIEYYYEWDFPGSIFNVVEFTTGISMLSSYFELEATDDIDIDLKSYNNITVYEDTSAPYGQQILYAENTDVLEEEEELFSFPMRYMPRLEYSATLGSQRNENLTWNDFHPFKTTLNTEAYLKDKGLKKLIKSIPKFNNEERQIFEIDNYLKSNFDFTVEEGSEFRSIKSIIQSGVITGNESSGILAAILKKMDIDYKLGYTTNRTEKDFDIEFLNSHNLQFLFFYFPKYEKYLMPTAPNLRYAFLPFQLTENNAILFDDNINAQYVSHYIPAKDSRDNTHNHTVSLSLLGSMDSVQISTEESLNGDSKSDALPAFATAGITEAKKMVEPYVKPDEGDRVLDLNIENAKWTSFLYDKPLVFKSKVNSAHILQPVADTEFLLNIGSVIGKQAELPRRSSKRKYDIDMSAPHSLIRKITLEIPTGYKVVNLEDLNMEKSLSAGTESECYFRSSYELSGNVLTVNIDERYKQSHLPRSEYEAFREVINAAAEFNKLDLLISKE